MMPNELPTKCTFLIPSAAVRAADWVAVMRRWIRLVQHGSVIPCNRVLWGIEDIPYTIPQPVIVPDDVSYIGQLVGTGEQFHIPACIFNKVDGMRLALGPGLTFTPFRIY